MKTFMFWVSVGSFQYIGITRTIDASGAEKTVRTKFEVS